MCLYYFNKRELIVSKKKKNKRELITITEKKNKQAPLIAVHFVARFISGLEIHSTLIQVYNPSVCG